MPITSSQEALKSLVIKSAAAAEKAISDGQVEQARAMGEIAKGAAFAQAQLDKAESDRVRAKAEAERVVLTLGQQIEGQGMKVTDLIQLSATSSVIAKELEATKKEVEGLRRLVISRQTAEVMNRVAADHVETHPVEEQARY